MRDIRNRPFISASIENFDGETLRYRTVTVVEDWKRQPRISCFFKVKSNLAGRGPHVDRTPVQSRKMDGNTVALYSVNAGIRRHARKLIDEHHRSRDQTGETRHEAESKQ